MLMGRKSNETSHKWAWWLGALAVFVMAMAPVVPGDVHAQSRSQRGSEAKEGSGWIKIYTHHGATATVDGKPYPKRAEYGMKVSANERHQVVVRQGEKEKTYVIVVRPRELRTLMVDLAGYQTPPAPAPRASAASKGPTPYKPPAKAEEEGDEKGKLTVYSKPKGEVFVDGSPLGATTPMINRELDLGRHEVQVRWENGEMSEVKTIRIRKGSKLKLFFRDRSK